LRARREFLPGKKKIRTLRIIKTGSAQLVSENILGLLGTRARVGKSSFRGREKVRVKEEREYSGMGKRHGCIARGKQTGRISEGVDFSHGTQKEEEKTGKGSKAVVAKKKFTFTS